MTSPTCLGIWLDHASANIMAYSPDTMETETLDSQFTNQEKLHSLSKGESNMHNKEQQLQHSYYKALGEVISGYESVLLFGPTDAKTELFNFLRADHRYDAIKIEVQPADKMTDNQQYAFVKAFFEKKG